MIEIVEDLDQVLDIINSLEEENKNYVFREFSDDKDKSIVFYRIQEKRLLLLHKEKGELSAIFSLTSNELISYIQYAFFYPQENKDSLIKQIRNSFEGYDI